MSAWTDTPVFVNNRNNLDRGFRSLVRWLADAGMTRVCVIDNASTWEPLLDFYDDMDSRTFGLVRLSENKGPYAFWELGMNRVPERFIVTDPDLRIPASCPSDLICRMHKLMDSRSDACKVGPSLRIDNLPSHYEKNADVLAWEGQFWTKPVPADAQKPFAYDALIDTTFALYQPGSEAWPSVGTHYRLAPPYAIEHVPWYEDSAEFNSEREHYLANCRRDWTHWSRVQ